MNAQRQQTVTDILQNLHGRTTGASRTDFALDVYIEYWGMDTPQYKMSMYKKQTLYQQEGKRLVSVYPADQPRLDVLLTAKLNLFGFTVA